jgi:hypothetical protein
LRCACRRGDAGNAGKRGRRGCPGTEWGVSWDSQSRRAGASTAATIPRCVWRASFISVSSSRWRDRGRRASVDRLAGEREGPEVVRAGRRTTPGRGPRTTARSGRSLAPSTSSGPSSGATGAPPPSSTGPCARPRRARLRRRSTRSRGPRNRRRPAPSRGSPPTEPPCTGRTRARSCGCASRRTTA